MRVKMQFITDQKNVHADIEDLDGSLKAADKDKDPALFNLLSALKEYGDALHKQHPDAHKVNL